jgi:hypothetical protein
MTELCIQIHPHRCPGRELGSALSQCRRLSTQRSWIRHFSQTDGFDQHAYVNLIFEADDVRLLWKFLSEQLYDASGLGQFMRGTSIVTCQGSSGWDDYLLLHHFDPGVICNRLLE